MLLIHWRDVIEPVKIGQRLKISLMFDQFLGPAMQKPNMRVNALDDLAVEFKHQTQHAVRRRVLRSEIDREIARSGFGHSRLASVHQNPIPPVPVPICRPRIMSFGRRPSSTYVGR